MNFYLDFEAGQFSDEIISIGCVADNGETFRQLVQPHDYSVVTKFITKLTGLTTEMLQTEGVNANEAFLRFKDFVQKQTQETVPAYYCYGDNDKHFLSQTMKYMSNFEASTFVASVMGLLEDYSKEVRKYLAVHQGIALQKLVMLVRHSEDVTQTHDSLDDAMMLKECFGRLDAISPDGPDVKRIMNKQIPRVGKAIPIPFDTCLEPISDCESVIHKITPEMESYLASLRSTWNTTPKENIHGDVPEEEATVKLTQVYTGEVKYFSAPIVAATYLNMKVRNKQSSKNFQVLQNTVINMFKNPNNFCKYRCELIEKDV